MAKDRYYVKQNIYDIERALIEYQIMDSETNYRIQQPPSKSKAEANRQCKRLNDGEKRRLAREAKNKEERDKKK